MKIAPWLNAALLTLGLMVVGCDKAKDTTPSLPKETSKDGKDKGKKEEEPGHPHEEGPHGGTVFDLSKYHAEFCVDHKTKEVTVYINSINLKKLVPIKAEKLSLSIKKPMLTVALVAKPMEGEPKGESSRFVAKNDAFGVEQEFEGTVTVEIDGKPFSGDFKEEAHDHKKDKK